MRVSRPSQAAFLLIGFTSILAQIVLARELLVVFYGNEISLGVILTNWLLWTAFGSGALGRYVGRVRKPRWFMAGFEAVIAVVFPLSILFVRASKSFFRPTPGEILGPGPMFLTSLVVLSLLCTTTGLLFATGSRLWSQESGASTVQASSSVYWLEAVGSGAGGLLASLVLIRYLDTFEIASWVSFLNLAAAASLAFEAPRLRRAALALLVVGFALLVFPFVNGRLERVSLTWLWRGFRLVATRNSIYGNLAVVQSEGSRSLFVNGLVVSTAPDPAGAEEAVHFALLQHPSPQSLVLIGGGTNGSIAQALQHSTLERIDYVELDPAIFDLARSFFPSEWAPTQSDPRVHTHVVDGRLFLKTTENSFDLIILNLPDPQTAQLNRFYTLEFFREVAARLTPQGVFSFQLRAAEDYISPELADFLRCIRKTLSEVFPAVTFIPGETVHFFAARRAGMLTAGPQELIARLRSRGLRAHYVREYYLPFRMSPDRMADLEMQTRPLAGTPVNRDFAPIAYYFDVSLWSTRFNRSFRRAFQSLAGVRFGSVVMVAALLLFALAGLLHSAWKPERRAKSAAGLSVAATGFTMMGLEMLLLLGFQAIYGYVYHQLAILIAAFMAGMAAGSWRALRRSRRPESRERFEIAESLRYLAGIQILVAFSPLLLYALLTAFSQVRSALGLFVVSQIAFPVLAILAGLLGGYQFPVASGVFFGSSAYESRGAGALYAIDLVGACMGALALSVYFVPVFGFFRTSILMTVVNLAPVALGFLSAFGKPVPSA